MIETDSGKYDKFANRYIYTFFQNSNDIGQLRINLDTLEAKFLYKGIRYLLGNVSVDFRDQFLSFQKSTRIHVLAEYLKENIEQVPTELEVELREFIHKHS
jgi:hypothetical protein